MHKTLVTLNKKGK